MTGAAWCGVLVYAGALFAESYGASSAVAAAVLAVAAAAYLPANLLLRRWVDRHARPLLVALGLAGAAGTAAFGGLREGIWPSAALLAALFFIAGGRTLDGSAFGLAAAGEERLAVMGIPAAALQVGYLLGAAIGGLAVSLGGYELLGWTLSALFVAGVLPHTWALASPQLRPAAAARPALA